MYGKELTKKVLMEDFNITDVTKDGKIFCDGKEVRQFDINSGYLAVNLYNKKLYKVLYPITKSRSAGEITIPVQRVVFAWWYGKCSAKMHIDHIDRDKHNNHKDNLREMRPGENIWRDREHDVREMKCKFKPRSFYEDKLTGYEAEYQKYLDIGDQNKLHKLRSYISQYKAKLRYWDSHYATK